MVELSTLHGETQFLAFRAADALSSLEEFLEGAWSVGKYSARRDSRLSSQLKQAHAHEALHITVKGQSRALGTQSALGKHMEVDELISRLINQYNQGPSIKEQHTHKAVLLWRFYSRPIE